MPPSGNSPLDFAGKHQYLMYLRGGGSIDTRPGQGVLERAGDNLGRRALQRAG